MGMLYDHLWEDAPNTENEQGRSLWGRKRSHHSYLSYSVGQRRESIYLFEKCFHTERTSLVFQVHYNCTTMKVKILICTVYIR